jgi:hypothetical protein
VYSSLAPLPIMTELRLTGDMPAWRNFLLLSKIAEANMGI